MHRTLGAMALFAAASLPATAAPKVSDCVTDPKATLRQQCDFAPANADDVRAVELEDVDGDGKQELLLACPDLCGATGNCPYKLYVSGNGCWRDVGPDDMGGSIISVAKSQHHGLKDIHQYWKGGCVGREGTWAELHFDGTRYRVARTVRCECEDKRPRPRECPGGS